MEMGVESGTPERPYQIAAKVPLTRAVQDGLCAEISRVAGVNPVTRRDALVAMAVVTRLLARFADDIGAGVDVLIGLTSDEEDLYLRMSAGHRVEPAKTLAESERLVAGGLLESVDIDHDEDVTYVVAQRPWARGRT